MVLLVLTISFGFGRLPAAARLCYWFSVQHCSHTVNLEIMRPSCLVRFTRNLQLLSSLFFAAMSNWEQTHCMEVVSTAMLDHC